MKEMKHMDSRHEYAAMEEADLLNKLRHKHIVRYVDSFFFENVFYIVQELANEGHLGKHINAQKGVLWKSETVVDFLGQIVAGMRYLHDNKIMHRDLKPENILAHRQGGSDRLLLKMADFGLSREMDDNEYYASTRCGTKWYMSPESNKGKYSLASDVWAIGCVLYEIWYKLFHHKTQKSNLNQHFKFPIHISFEFMLSKYIYCVYFCSTLERLFHRTIDIHEGNIPRISKIITAVSSSWNWKRLDILCTHSNVTATLIYNRLHPNRFGCNVLCVIPNLRLLYCPIFV